MPKRIIFQFEDDLDYQIEADYAGLMSFYSGIVQRVIKTC